MNGGGGNGKRGNSKPQSNSASCNHCGMKGHIERNCREKKDAQAQEIPASRFDHLCPKELSTLPAMQWPEGAGQHAARIKLLVCIGHGARSAVLKLEDRLASLKATAQKKYVTYSRVFDTKHEHTIPIRGDAERAKLELEITQLKSDAEAASTIVVADLPKILQEVAKVPSANFQLTDFFLKAYGNESHVTKSYSRVCRGQSIQATPDERMDAFMKWYEAISAAIKKNADAEIAAFEEQRAARAARLQIQANGGTQEIQKSMQDLLTRFSRIPPEQRQAALVILQAGGSGAMTD